MKQSTYMAAVSAGVVLAVAGVASAQGYYDPNAQQQYQQPAQAAQPVDPNAQQPAPIYQTDPGAQYAQPAQDPQAVAQDPNAQLQQQVAQPQAQPVDPNAQAAQVPADDATSTEYDDGYDPNAASQFQSQLAPYGQWVDSPDYGRVWVPSASQVGSDFTPYGTNGHWALTEAGWTWVSDYPWGWAPFHYGRWVHAGNYGWSWVPGTVWGPAWVSWRSANGYVGWAPMGPRGAVYANSGYNPWRFVAAGHLGYAHPEYVGAGYVPGLLARASVINTMRTVSVGGVNVRVNAGPAFGAAGGSVSLRSVSGAVYPRVNIAPRLGTPMGSRPWVARGVGTYRPAPAYGAGGYARPAYAAPAYRAGYVGGGYAAPAYRGGYAAPAYRGGYYGGGGGYNGGGGYRGGYGGGGYVGGGYRGGGGYSGGGGGGYRGGGGFSGGGGGGYHGGGGGGGHGGGRR